MTPNARDDVMQKDCLNKEAGLGPSRPALPLCPLGMKQLWRATDSMETVNGACGSISLNEQLTAAFEIE